MKKLQIKAVLVLISLASLGSAEPTQTGNFLPKENLIKRMQKGGVILYFRHASTEKDYADQINAKVNDGSTQRVLSEKGWHEAVHIGRAIRYVFFKHRVIDIKTSINF